MKFSKTVLAVFLIHTIIMTPCTLMHAQELGGEAEIPGITDDASGNVTLDFKDADIRNVLRILSYKGGVNIVAAKGVEGPVTIRLTDVPWNKALDVLLKTYDYGYEKDANIISVSPLETLTQKKLAEKELAEVEPLVTEVFHMEYIDATDVKQVIDEQLSARGKATVFLKKVQKGWPFGAGGGAGGGKTGGVTGFGAVDRDQEEPRAKTLVVSDIVSYMARIKKVITQIDIKSKQVLIEARIVEVNQDRLKDLGFDWGTGADGAQSSTLNTVFTGKNNKKEFGGQTLGGLVSPSIFDPKATGINSSFPFDAGLSLVFRKLTGTQFEVILHALEEEVESNTLSAPRIMTLDNQQATILIGKSQPVLKSEISSGDTSSAVTQTLDYYQNLGIVLNVIPQVSADDYINMVVHPAVYSTTDSVSATSTLSSGDSVTTTYPIVLMREADTQILMKNGETIVIGGLLKDVKKEGKLSVPILGDIPIIGTLFQRNTTDVEKIDLLIFLTARIVNPEEATKTDYGISMITEEKYDQTAASTEKFLDAGKLEEIDIIDIQEIPREEY